MANYTCTTNMTLEQCIAAGSMVDGENLTINSGAVVTCDRTPSILIGTVTINEGELFIDGANIGAGNMINFVGEATQIITVAGQGILRVEGDWYDIGTTDGSNSQTFNLATYYDTSFCVDCVPMIQVETGRRIDFDNSTGTAPEVDDFVYKTSNTSVMGRIIQVESTYLIVKYLTGSLADDDAIHVQKVVQDKGSDMQISWTANVNNVSGDILEEGVYQEFANCRANGNSFISAFHHGVGGFVFDNQWQSTTLTMGSAAGATGGFCPPTGCNVRVPNVHFSQATTTTYASNQTYHDGTTTEANLYNLSTSASGEVYFSICNFGSVWFGCTLASVFEAEYCGAFIDMGTTACGGVPTYHHCVVSEDPINRAVGVGYAFNIVDCVNGAEIIDCMSVISQVRYNRIGAETSSDIICNGNIITMAAQGGTWTTSGNNMYYFSLCSNVTFANNIAIGNDNIEMDNNLYLSAISDFTGTNFRYSCTQDEVEQTTEVNVIYITTGCSDINITGIFQIGAGSPGNYLAYVSDSTFVTLRCYGMIDDKISYGVDGEYIVGLVGACSDIEISRMWVDAGVALIGSVLIPTTAKRVYVQNCSSKYLSNVKPGGANNIKYKGVHGGSGLPGATDGLEDVYTACYGRQIHDGFRSDTVGWITCFMIPPSDTVNYVTKVAGNPKFFRDGDLDMYNGDIIEFEMDYFAKGHTGFSGTYTSVITTSAWNADEFTNVDLYFQYDVNDGGGWNGSWLNVRTAGNWTGITVDPEDGVKLKFRFEATGTMLDMSMLIIDTTTTLTDQKANFYDISQSYELELTGLIAGSEVRCYTGTDPATAVEIGGIESSSTSYAFNHTSGSVDGYIVIHALGYQSWRIPYTYESADVSIPVVQILDRQYNNPA